MRPEKEGGAAHYGPLPSILYRQGVETSTRFQTRGVNRGPKIAAIIPAAGHGRRMGMDKMLLPLGGIPVVVRTLRLFKTAPAIVQVILAVKAEDLHRYREDILPSWDLDDVTLVPGGEERWQSVAAGLAALWEDVTLVAVHDGARPLLTPELLNRSLEVGAALGAVVLGMPAVDTVKEAGESVVLGTLDRRRLWLIQTPQVFAVDLLRRAYAEVTWGKGGAASVHTPGDCDGFQNITDDASLVERLGAKVHLLEGSLENLKITRPLDLRLAEAILDFREGGEKGRRAAMRVGFGYDIHPFAPDRPLWLGGVNILGESGLAGHSDADVVLHALMDALLGAVGEPDIGHFFPPGEERFRDASSAGLLAQVTRILKAKGASVVNADLTVVTERPRVAPYAREIKEKIACILECAPGRIGLKATTNEGLGTIGRGEGIAAWAVVLVELGER